MDIGRAKPQVVRLLSDVTGQEMESDETDAGLLVRGGPYAFDVAYRAQASAQQVGDALRRLGNASGARPAPRIGIVAVPYMGDVGRTLCEQADVSWMDLSGNVSLTGPGLRLLIQGRPNRFPARGRRPSLFAPRAARLARSLLLDPHRTWTRRELVDHTGLDKGYMSRLLRAYAAADFVSLSATTAGPVSTERPAVLLATWRAEHRFPEGHVVYGHVAARGGVEALSSVCVCMESASVSQYAATGLAAAWKLAPFAGFRLTTLYVDEVPDTHKLRSAGFYEGAAGSNVWLVCRPDAGVFTGASIVDGVPCVSPLQAYLDLKGMPERADEAADELLRTRLPWATAR